MRISDWSSDVCSSDLQFQHVAIGRGLQCKRLLGGCRYPQQADAARTPGHALDGAGRFKRIEVVLRRAHAAESEGAGNLRLRRRHALGLDARSEEHTSELQSLMRISYAVFCLKKKNTSHRITRTAGIIK